MAYSYGGNFILLQTMRRSFTNLRPPALLLVNGVNYLLLVDGSSRLLLASP